MSDIKSPILVKCLSLRLFQALRIKDWFFFIGCGIILPFLYVLAVIRFTPWGGRDSSLLSVNFILPTMQYIGFVVLVICMLLIVIRWRLKSMAAVFGFPKRSPWFLYCILLCCLIYIQLIGFGVIQKATSQLIIGRALYSVSTMWLLVKVFQVVFGKSELLIYRGLMARIFIPAFAVAMVCLLTSIFYLEHAEQYWLNKDTIIRMDATRKEGPYFEYTIAKQLEKETRAIIDGDF